MVVDAVGPLPLQGAKDHNFALASFCVVIIPCWHNHSLHPSPIPTVKRTQTHTMNLQLIKHLLRALLALFVFIVKLAEAGIVTVTIGQDAATNRVFAGWVGSLSGLPPIPSNSFTLPLNIGLDPGEAYLCLGNGAITC
jgi:hypothetical protein